MTLEQKLKNSLTGVIYDPNEKEIITEQYRCTDILYEFNQIRPTDLKKRDEVLKRFFAEVGEGCHIEGQLNATWGCNTHFGKGIYANHNLTLIDDGEIFVGDYTMFGPNVTIATAGHPIDPELRKKPYQYNLTVHIGSNVWLGAGVVVLPGVSIGDNSVVGAGSIVTKDIPADVIAVGNPCKVLREIGEHDKEYYYKDRKIDYSTL